MSNKQNIRNSRNTKKLSGPFLNTFFLHLQNFIQDNICTVMLA